MLLAVKRYAAASKCYAKGVLALSLLVNRSIFAPGDVHSKLLSETFWHIGEGLVAGTKDVEWVKLHFGPLSLNERTTAGYASWSFEDAESQRVKDQLAIRMGPAERVCHNGQTLATWRAGSPTSRVDVTRLRKERPEVVSEYLVESPAQRRLLLGGAQNA